MWYKKIFFFSVLILSLVLSGCGASKNTTGMASGTKNILMVVAPMDFRDKEYFDTRQELESGGYKIKVASIQSGTAVGTEGAKVKIDLTVSSVAVKDYDGVVFIGGPGMAQITSDDTLKNLALRFSHGGKVVGAICVAPSILAKAGLLSGKKATGWEEIKNDIVDGGAIYTPESVVSDGLVITAQGPESAKEFGRRIMEKIPKT